MAAHIVRLDRLPAASESGPLSLPGEAPGCRPGRHLWRGASGRGYRHDVYSLIGCPPLPRASFVLVRRDEHGRCRALRVGAGQSDALTLNLAQVRQQGALDGANEVHVYLGAPSDAERRLIVCDLRAGLLGTLCD